MVIFLLKIGVNELLRKTLAICTLIGSIESKLMNEIHDSEFNLFASVLMAANFLTSFNKWPDANRYSQRNFIKAEERLRCCIRLRVTVNQQVSNSIKSLYIHLRFPFYHFLYLVSKFSLFRIFSP